MLAYRKNMPAEKPNKNELRTKATRELLLRAAEKIFARDGYEGAELGEIAAAAGRTKGAIYDHFKNKEDVFLALIEERVKRNKAQMEAMLAESRSTEQNLLAYRQFCLSLVEDEAWALLLLEFKLFAIRHPESKERLQKFYYEKFLPGNQEKKFVQLLGAAGNGRDALSRSAAVQTLQPLLSTLVVEAKFAPALLGEHARKKVAARIFDALMQSRPV